MEAAQAVVARIGRGKHTSQSQAITGTPCDVPVPKNVMVTAAVLFVLVDAKMQSVSHQAVL
jgi:hypothetical protein